jgi:hypothetical protein
VFQLTLGTDEQDLLTLANQFRRQLFGTIELPQGLVEINDVDAIPFGEDEFSHLGVPTTRLVAEVNPRLE